MHQPIDCAIDTLTYQPASQTVCCQPKCRTWISFAINWSIAHVRTPNSTSFEWFRWKRFDRIHILCNWPSICRWLFDPHNGTLHWVRWKWCSSDARPLEISLGIPHRTPSSAICQTGPSLLEWDQMHVSVYYWRQFHYYNCGCHHWLRHRLL